MNVSNRHFSNILLVDNLNRISSKRNDAASSRAFRTDNVVIYVSEGNWVKRLRHLRYHTLTTPFTSLSAVSIRIQGESNPLKATFEETSLYHVNQCTKTKNIRRTDLKISSFRKFLKVITNLL